MEENIHDMYRTALLSAHQAGKYLMKRFRKQDTRVEKNLKYDVKLDVDVEAENIIKNIIKNNFAHHLFIGEEGGTEPSSPNGIEDSANPSAYQWIVDPLDGSVNFLKGIPHFCVSIALKKDNQYLLGVVFDPVKHETFSALRPEGAFLNKKPIKRKNISLLEDAVVSGAFLKAGSIEIGTQALEKISNRVKKIRFFGSAALDFCYLACGRVNVYIQFAVHEWDIAAASLIAELSGVRQKIWEHNGKLNVLGADNDIFEQLIDYVS
ncbi:MAG: inositol monophosphatase family protein [Spirochaetota bacterium]